MQKIIPFKKEMPFKSEVSEITSISLEHTLHKEKENLITGIFTISGDYKVIDTSNIIDHFSFEIPFDIHIDNKYDLEKVHIDIDDFYYEIINNKSLMINIDVLLDKIEEIETVRVNKEEVLEELDKVEKELEEREEKENPQRIEDLLNEEASINIEKKEENISEREILNEIEEKSSEIVSLQTEPASKEVSSSFVESTSKEIPTSLTKNTKEIDTSTYIEPKTEIKEVSKTESVEAVSSIFDTFDKNTSTSSIYKVYMVREEDSLESILAKYKTTKEELEKYNNLKEMKKGDKLIIPAIESEKI